MLWEVKTAEKKNVFQRTHYIVPDDSEIAAGKVFYIEEWYRWGSCIIESNTKPVVANDPYSYPFVPGNYEVQDQESDDGCTLDFVFEEDDEWTAEEKQYIEDLWEQDAWFAFTENGIESIDCDVEYYGPLEIECVDETPTPEKPHGSNVKGAWPFPTE